MTIFSSFMNIFKNDDNCEINREKIILILRYYEFNAYIYEFIYIYGIKCNLKSIKKQIAIINHI